MKWSNFAKMRLVLIGVVAAIMFCGGSAKAYFTFGEPTSLGLAVNGQSGGLAAYESADGLSLYFSSNRPDGQGDYDIWVATREKTGDEWRSPENLGPLVNDSGEDFHPCISADGLELYFDSNRTEGLGSMDLYVTKRATRNDPWSAPMNLGPGVNSTTVDKDAALSADGLELYFASCRDTGRPRLILYVTKRESKDAPWGVPVSLGPVVNSWDCQQGPSISSDGLALVFNDFASICTPRPGGLGEADLWLSVRATRDGEWGPPVNLGPPINTPNYDQFGMISADGSTLFLNAGSVAGGMYLSQAPIIPIVDFDADGYVGVNDRQILMDFWGTDEQLCDIGPMPWGDGVVDDADLEVLMAYWEQDVTNPHDPRLARNPKPADHAFTDAEKVLSLTWIPGVRAIQHDIYFGPDPVSVEDANASDTTGIYLCRQEACEYTTLPEGVETGRTYYWRIDELKNNGTLIKGRLWSFTVAEYLIVDDMETGSVWERWWDGWEDPTNGSEIWDETNIVHSGERSMALFYDNSTTPISRVERGWEISQDWTRKGVETLTLWFHGNQNNAVDPFYVSLKEDKGSEASAQEAVKIHPDVTAVRSEDWQPWSIPLTDFNGVDPQKIVKMTLGVGDPRNNTDPGGSGQLFIDDIYLTPISTQFVQLIAHWALDETEGAVAYDSAGENHAEVIGSAVWQPAGGVVDGALLLDGVNDCVATEYVRDPSEGPLSVFAWVKGGAPGQVVVSQIVGTNWLMADSSSGNLVTELRESGRAGRPLLADTVITDGNWHRVGLVWDGANRILYVDDVVVAADTQSALVGSNGGLNIGCGKNVASGSFWSGLIDEVRIYNRAVKP